MTDLTKKDAGLTQALCPSCKHRSHLGRICGIVLEFNKTPLPTCTCEDVFAESTETSTSHQSPATSHQADEPYIRDVSAANFGVEIRTVDDAAALCGDDKQFCEYCGAEFPLWPVRLWAAHIVHEHHGD